jgi:4-amino-4-deoxy-L-arabinose transferase-like glycosyltransferase
LYNPDEYFFVNPAVRVIAAGDFNPHWFGHPGSTLIYMLSFLYGLFYLFGKLFGLFPNIQSFTALLQNNPTAFYLIGRAFTVTLGALSVLLVYRISKKIFDRNTGLVAALFLTVSYLHSIHSQLIRTDVISTFFILSAFLLCISIYQQGQLKYYIGAGLLVGFSIASKYPSFFIIVALVLAHVFSQADIFKKEKIDVTKSKTILILVVSIGYFFMTVLLIKSRSLLEYACRHLSSDGIIKPSALQTINTIQRICIGGYVFILILLLLMICIKPIRNFMINLLVNKHLLIGLAAVVFGFFIASPYFFIDYKTSIKNLLLESGSEHLGAENLGVFNNYLWYIQYALKQGLGIQVELLAGLGIPFLLWKHKKIGLLLLSFPLIFFLFIGTAKLRWERYIIPLLPFMAIFAAYALVKTVDQLSRIQYIRIKSNDVLFVLSVAMTFNLIVKIIRYDYYISQKDTRTFCKEWVEKNIPYGTKMAQDWYTGEISDKQYQITKEMSISEKPLQYYQENGFQYMLVSSWLYNRYYRSSAKYPDRVAFYDTLFVRGELIKEFLQDQRNKPGPTIRIYKIN